MNQSTVFVVRLAFVALFLAWTTTAAAAEATATDEGSEEAGAPFLWMSAMGGSSAILTEDWDAQPGWAARASVDADVGFGLRVGVSYAHMGYQTTYLRRELPVLQGRVDFSEVSVDEQWMDARLAISYNVLDLVTDLLALRIGVAPRYSTFQADGFPSWFFAPAPFGEVELPLGDRASIEAGFELAPAVMGNDETRAAQGLPKYLYDYHGQVGVALMDDPTVRLVVRYQGFTLIRELTERSYHGVLAGVAMGI